MRMTKTPLASENFVDVFGLLPRWQLDSVEISCQQFRHIVSTMMATVCLREFVSITIFPTKPSDPSSISVHWQLAEKGEEVELEDATKRFTSSAVQRIVLWNLEFTDEMLLKIVEAMGSVNVAKLRLFHCDFSSASDGSVSALISSFAYLRDLRLNECGLTPAQYTIELLLDCARRPELARASFDVNLPENDDEEAGEVRADHLDAGILALLFREVGDGVEVAFMEAIISDEFSRRLLQKADQYTGTTNVKLLVRDCDIEQQMVHLGDFQQFRRTIAASGLSPAKTIYELPANGRRKCTLTFTESFLISPLELRFASAEAANH